MNWNWEQVRGAADRLILIGLTYLASKGYITPGDIGVFAPAILAAAGAIFSVYVNRNSALVSSAANVPNPNSPTGKTIVVTTPEIATSIPDKNVVSSADNKVVSK